jgi:Mn2+/Fe2+ NRAMP family transporter
MLVLTSVDPIKVTEYSLVLSALALPLTYFPILVIANDPDYMGSRTNSRLGNALGSLYFMIVMVASAAAIPLMLVTKAGQ